MKGALASLVDAGNKRLQRAGMPEWTAPMLATLTEECFSSEDWLYERKLDGERCLVFSERRGLRILSRNKQKLNATYPELVERLEAGGPERYIVDGEIVAFDSKLTSFGRLQQRIGFTEWTSGGKLRHPRYIGLREDKPAGKVRRERPKRG